MKILLRRNFLIEVYWVKLFQRKGKFIYQYDTLQFKHLKGIRATSSLPTFSPILVPTTDTNINVTTMRINVRNVQNQDSGESSFVRFQNFDFSIGYLVHQYHGEYELVQGLPTWKIIIIESYIILILHKGILRQSKMTLKNYSQQLLLLSINLAVQKGQLALGSPRLPTLWERFGLQGKPSKVIFSFTQPFLVF